MLELLSLRKGTTLTKEMFLKSSLWRHGRARAQNHRRLYLQTSEKTGGGYRVALHYIETVWGRGYVLRDPDAEIEAA